ncbi:potassium/proton antiporter (CPA1 family) [Ilumatobacter fluminis]|uniref:Potassium/proton antiporter (CPA1 family) n=1 Tax=Ilumatobacter fluminis TaxID=467091 RepID=A0A4V3EIV4_9ACTN|nr:potassium/proton antiporter [Ilumatobacter fluminis]TDT15848.1 potassium/proton antiporter (CPA1 family) [Ilumatobacter fluminis]
MEPQPLILVAGVLLLIGVLASKPSSRYGVPGLLLFLGLGMLAGSDGIGGIEFDDVELARSFGIVALAFILFSGGLGTKYVDIKRVLAPGLTLATVGVAVTALALGGLSSWLLDISLQEGFLLGAVVASTDAAAVFAILRSRGIAMEQRLGSMLELESGSNDPAAVFLTLAMIDVIEGDASAGSIVASFFLQMSIGLVAGYVLARAAIWVINRVALDFDGLYPVFTFAFVLIVLEGVSQLGGSGFLALYVAGVTLGSRNFVHKRSLIRFHDAVAWLMQIAMFVMLGLLVFPSDFPDVVLPALAVTALLMFVARPLAAFATLLPYRLPARQVAFVSWVGLRGATPIILATFPVAAGLDNSSVLFNVVFFVVLTSVLIQGTTIGTAAKWLKLGGDPPPPREISFDSVITGDDGPQLHEVTVPATAAATGRALLDLGLPAGVLVVLVRRGDHSFMPQGNTVLEVDDDVLIVAEQEHRPRLAELFDATLVPAEIDELDDLDDDHDDDQRPEGTM